MTNSEVIVHQYGTGVFTVGSLLSGGTGSLVKLGDGTLVLSGNNTFTGGAGTIHAGVVQLGSTGALSAPSAPSDALNRWFGSVASLPMSGRNAVTFGSGSTGTLRLNGFNVSLTGLATNAVAPGSAVVENRSATSARLTLNQAVGTNSTFAGIMQDGPGGGSLSLYKVGDGSLTLTNSANSFTGQTIINNGTVTIANNGAVSDPDFNRSDQRHRRFRRVRRHSGSRRRRYALQFHPRRQRLRPRLQCRKRGFGLYQRQANRSAATSSAATPAPNRASMPPRVRPRLRGRSPRTDCLSSAARAIKSSAVSSPEARRGPLSPRIATAAWRARWC